MAAASNLPRMAAYTPVESIRRFRKFHFARCLLLLLPALIGGEGCGSNRSTIETETAPRLDPQRAPYHEAPEVAALVAAGKLPPIEQRLPTNPFVVQPVERPGIYGGAWRMGVFTNNDHNLIMRTIGYENLVRWDPQWNHVVPNLAERFEESSDRRVYTFHLRKGIRWSDGAPFTTADIEFWHKYVYTTYELAGTRPAWLESGGERVALERVDDFTVRFKFAEPNGLFLRILAQPQGAAITSYPKHYMQRFHVAFNPNEVPELVLREEVDDWSKLFQKKFGSDFSKIEHWQNPELPRLNAWVITNAYGGPEPVVAIRNPYYWKIDTVGNQLPYIDKVVFNPASGPDELLSMATNGLIDMQDRTFATQLNRSIIEQSREQGDYHLFETIPSFCNSTVIIFNQNATNSGKRALFQNKDFRVALSHAIDRNTIIREIHGGRARPSQTAPRTESPYYDLRLASQYTEFDRATSNRLLDQIGLAERGADGFRLDPTGQPLRLEIIIDKSVPYQIPTTKMISDYWRAVGIRASVLLPDNYGGMIRSNYFEITIQRSFGGLDTLVDPYYFMPLSAGSPIAVMWANWYDPRSVDYKNPEWIPPSPVQRQWEIYEQIKTSKSPTLQTAYLQSILQIAAEQFYTIGVCQPDYGYGIVKNSLHNVPRMMPDAFTYPHPAPTNPCQYFFDTNSPPMEGGARGNHNVPVSTLNRQHGAPQ